MLSASTGDRRVVVVVSQGHGEPAEATLQRNVTGTSPLLVAEGKGATEETSNHTGRCKRMVHPDVSPEITPVEQADIAIVTQLAQHRHDPAVRAITASRNLASEPLLLAVSGMVIALGLQAGNHRLARQGGHLFAAVALATLIKDMMKRAVARTRPNLLLDQDVYRVKLLGPNRGPWNSFPSGHTAAAAALARAIVRCWPQARLPAYSSAVAVGLVQVPRGAHYPTDVLAGMLIGVVAEAIVNRAFPLD